MKAHLLPSLPDGRDPVDHGLLETARRKAFYARMSAAAAELLRQDHSISRPEYDRRLEAARAAEHGLRMALARTPDGALPAQLRERP
jgi:hypothetical protein